MGAHHRDQRHADVRSHESVPAEDDHLLSLDERQGTHREGLACPPSHTENRQLKLARPVCSATVQARIPVLEIDGELTS